MRRPRDLPSELERPLTHCGHCLIVLEEMLKPQSGICFQTIPAQYSAGPGLNRPKELSEKAVVVHAMGEWPAAHKLDDIAI